MFPDSIQQKLEGDWAVLLHQEFPDNIPLDPEEVHKKTVIILHVSTLARCSPQNIEWSKEYKQEFLSGFGATPEERRATMESIAGALINASKPITPRQMRHRLGVILDLLLVFETAQVMHRWLMRTHDYFNGKTPAQCLQEEDPIFLSYLTNTWGSQYRE